MLSKSTGQYRSRQQSFDQALEHSTGHMLTRDGLSSSIHHQKAHDSVLDSGLPHQCEAPADEDQTCGWSSFLSKLFSYLLRTSTTYDVVLSSHFALTRWTRASNIRKRLGAKIGHASRRSRKETISSQSRLAKDCECSRIERVGL